MKRRYNGGKNRSKVAPAEGCSETHSDQTPLPHTLMRREPLTTDFHLKFIPELEPVRCSWGLTPPHPPPTVSNCPKSLVFTAGIRCLFYHPSVRTFPCRSITQIWLSAAASWVAAIGGTCVTLLYGTKRLLHRTDRLHWSPPNDGTSGDTEQQGLWWTWCDAVI